MKPEKNNMSFKKGKKKTSKLGFPKPRLIS